MNNLKGRNEVLKARIKAAKGRIKKLKCILSTKLGIKLDRMEKKLNLLEQNIINLPGEEIFNIYEKWFKEIEADIDELFEMAETIVSKLKKPLQLKLPSPQLPSKKYGR